MWDKFAGVVAVLLMLLSATIVIMLMIWAVTAIGRAI